MFLFISGLSGAGKTTLGEKLKEEDGFTHFNVDVWAFGGNPTADSGAVPTPAMMERRDPVVKTAFDQMIQHGFQKLAAGEAVPFNVWENFFKLLCDAVVDYREKLGPSFKLVVSFSVYLRSVRDYIRSRLGSDLAFVVLNPSIESVGVHKVEHMRNTASQRGLTLSAFLRSFNPDSDAPEMEEESIIQLLTAQARQGAVGFEPAAADEPRTLGIGDVSVEEVHQRVREFVRTL